jgi:Leucine-rich repeat (LRR) protein
MGIIKSITKLQNLSNLETFDAEWNGLENIDLSKLTNLTYVNVGDQNKLTESTNINSLTTIDLTECNKLENLYVDDSNFVDGLDSITGLYNLTNLIWLDVAGNSLSGSFDFTMFSSIRTIEIRRNAVTDIVISNTQPINGIAATSNQLSTEAVDNILVTLSTNGVTGGAVYLNGSGNSAPSGVGLSAKNILESNFWEVLVN